MASLPNGSATVHILGATLSVPVAVMRSIAPTMTRVRIVGFNDQTLQFVPSAPGYASLQFPPAGAILGGGGSNAGAIAGIAAAAVGAVGITTAVVGWMTWRKRRQAAAELQAVREGGPQSVIRDPGEAPAPAAAPSE
jgi:hypothetical protein